MKRQEILAEVARSREAVSHSYRAARVELDLASQLGRSVRRKPMAWLGGAAALGWLLAGPKTKTRVVTKPARPGAAPSKGRPPARWGRMALLIALVRGLLPFVKPALTAYAGRRLAQFVNRPEK